jgi:hypothetical protein
MKSGNIRNILSFKTYIEKLIYIGENRNDKMMYHRRTDIKFNEQQNIFYKTTSSSIYTLIQSIKKTFKNAYISMVFKFEDIGFRRTPMFRLTEDILLMSTYPSSKTIKDIEKNPKKYRDIDIVEVKEHLDSTEQDTGTYDTTDGFFDFMIIYVAPYTVTDIKVGCNKNNDNNCMYESIKLSVGYYNQNKLIDTSKKFRKYFNMNETELFDLSFNNITKLEKIYNMPIIIDGWKDQSKYDHFIDPSNSNHSINLKLIKHNHIKLHIKEDRHYENDDKTRMIRLTNKKIRKGIICHKFNTEKKQIETFDGENLIYYDIETFNSMKNKDNYFYYEQTKIRKTVQEAFDEINTIKTDLDNININLFKYKSLNKFIIQSFLFHNEHLNNPDLICDTETRFITASYHHGLQYCISDNIDLNILKIDMNGCYQFYLCNKYFVIPHRKYDIYKYMTTEELYNEYSKHSTIKVGFYYCEVVKSEDENINKLFRFSTSNCYYYYDLKSAMLLNLKIIMLSKKSGNGEYIKNCILYTDNKSRISGYNAFNNFILDLYKDKYNEDKTKNYTIKMIIAKIQGLLSEKIKTKKQIKVFTEDEYKDFDKLDKNEDNDIVEIPKNKKYERKTTDYINKITIEDNIFRYRWGRIGACINAFVRFKMCDLIMKIQQKYNTFLNDIVAIQIDSIAVKTPEYWKPILLEFIKIDNDMGNWKIEKEGMAKIAFNHIVNDDE